MEVAVVRREPHGDHPLDELLGAPPVLDQVGDGDELEVVALAEPDQIGHARHRPVVVHDLADDARGCQPRQPGEIDRGLGLARTLEDTSVSRAEREDVARVDEVVGRRLRVDRDLDRLSAVGGRDPSRDSVARLDGDREGRVVRSLVLVGHLPQAELVAALGRQAQADQPAPVHRHEVHRLGRDELRGDREVALVLAVLVVDDDDEPPGADLLDRLLDRREGRFGHRRSRRAIVAGVNAGSTSRSTYFASTSTSRFTERPGPSSPSVVAVSVCGTSATANASSYSSATVSDTPSTVIEPFSTQ